MDVFTPGESGSKAFRIPGLLSTPQALLAYAEGRVEGCGDFDGTHTVVVKRSLDEWGHSISELRPEILFGHLDVSRQVVSGDDTGESIWMRTQQRPDTLRLSGLAINRSRSRFGNQEKFAKVETLRKLVRVGVTENVRIKNIQPPKCFFTSQSPSLR